MITQSEAIQIAKEMIAASFPELVSKKIKYSFVSGKKHDYYIAASVVFSQYQIFIEREILGFPKDAFKGCLATEFAHLVLDSRKSIFRLIEEKFNKSLLSVEERKADELAIERGYGPELLKFNKEHEKEYKAFNKSEALTKMEIQLKIKKGKK